MRVETDPVPDQTVMCPDRKLRSLKEAVNYAVEQGCIALMHEADARFPDTTHTMVFPKRAGFTAESETQTSDTFPRAVLAGALADALPHLSQGHCTAVRGLAAREAEHVWAARVPGMQCPFRYFPGLPELPPDADTLAAVLLLLAKVAPGHMAQLVPAIDALEADVNTRGWARTWQITATDPTSARTIMNRAIKDHWGDTFDVGVNAHVTLALTAVGRLDTARKVGQSLSTQQAEDGTFVPRWYAGEIIGTALCLTALRPVLPSARAVAVARHALLARQQQDGGWGLRRSDPLSTAYALWALSEDGPSDVLKRGAHCLLDHQRRDGTWNNVPWITMPIRGKGIGGCRVASFGSCSVTTALAVRTLASLTPIF